MMNLDLSGWIVSLLALNQEETRASSTLRMVTKVASGRRGGLVVSVLDTGSSGLGSGPGRGHCVVFLGKTLLSRCLSPPRCMNGYRRNAAGNPAMD